MLSEGRRMLSVDDAGLNAPIDGLWLGSRVQQAANLSVFAADRVSKPQLNVAMARRRTRRADYQKCEDGN